MSREDLGCEVGLLATGINELEEPKNTQDIAFVVWREAEFTQRADIDGGWKAASEMVYRLLQPSGRRNVRVFVSHACLICGIRVNSALICRRSPPSRAQYTR